MFDRYNTEDPCICKRNQLSSANLLEAGSDLQEHLGQDAPQLLIASSGDKLVERVNGLHRHLKSINQSIKLIQSKRISP